jgi:hypothetical protein
MQFQIRSFEKRVLLGKIPFEHDTYVIVNYYMRGGKQVFEYWHDTQKQYERFFRKENLDIDSIRIGKL